MFIQNERDHVKLATPDARMRWSALKRNWGECKGCNLCETRYTTVLYRGVAPCNILMIGEAPGDAENMCGLPFINTRTTVPIINKAATRISIAGLSWGLTNILACQPPDNRDPSMEEAVACQQRLRDTIDMASPQVVVLLGRVARSRYVWKDAKQPLYIPFIEAAHPVSIIRKQTQMEVSNATDDFLNKIGDAISIANV